MPFKPDKNGNLVYVENYTPKYTQLPNTLGVDLKKYEDYSPNEIVKGPFDQKQWDDQRAESQSGLAKFTNSVGQGLGTFGTALASTVTALGSGVVALGSEAISEGEAEGMDIFLNNPIMKGINEFDTYLKENLLPTYYTQEQQESLFSAATGTDLLNGLGFLASNIIPNAAVTKLFGSLGKMTNAAKAGKLVSILDKAADVGTITNAEKQLLSGVGKYFEKAPAVIGAAVGRVGESAMEAYGTYEQVKQSLEAESQLAQQELEIYGKTDKRILTPEQIEIEAKKQRDNVFGGNMALAVSDMMQFTRWFKGDNITNRLVKDGFKTTVKEVGKADLIKSLIKESSQEAAEEGFQFLLSKGAEKSAKGKSFIHGVSEASGELFTTIEGQKSMLLGAILGGGVSAAFNIRNEKELRPQLQQLANNLTLTGNVNNKYITTPEGEKVINPQFSKMATNFMFYEQQKQKAIEEGNQQAYDIAEKMQFSDLVSAKQDAGQLEEFIDELKQMGNSSIEEVESMFGELPIRNGRKVTPQEIVNDKIQLAERVKELNEGLSKLPNLQNQNKSTFNLIRHNLFTQETLRNEIGNIDLKIANVKSRAVNEYNLNTGEVQIGKLLPFDELELKGLEETRNIIFDVYAETTKKFNSYIANPKLAEKQVEKTQEDIVKEVVKQKEEEAKEVETKIQEKEVVDKNGNIFTIIDENPDGSLVLENQEGNIFTQSKEEFTKNFIQPKEELDNEETNDIEVSPEDERLQENLDRFIDPNSAKKENILASSGQAIQLDGNEILIENGEALLREEFKQQTEVFNKPTTSNNIVTSPSDKPNLVQFKAEIAEIEDLEETNKRREANGLTSLTQQDLESDEFIPIKLTFVFNGRANNDITHFFHTPDYYYKTAEYEEIESSTDDTEIKEQLHKYNLEKYKFIRSNLVKAIKENKSVILNTVSKSSGVLNYNPKVDGIRKTSSVLEVFESSNTIDFISPKSHNLYIMDNGKAQQLKTKGLRVVTNVEQLEDDTYKITTLDSVLGKNEFISTFPFTLGEMLYDIISPNGSVMTKSPFSKKSFTIEQIDNMASLILQKLMNGNIIEVNGLETSIIGTESNPGIIDSLIYVGTVKSKSPEAINSQLVFGKDGTLILGKQKITKEDPEAYNKIKAHLLQYKSKPQFKMRSKDIESFGIPVETEKGWKVEKPTSYLNFMFKGENALIQTALNKTKFVNTYFNFATDTNGNLLIESKKGISKESSQVEADKTNIEAKKADIEKRRQELNNKNEKFWEQITAIIAEEVADGDNLINKLIKDIQLPANTRINNWALEELNGKLWEGKNISGKEEEFFGKENWDKIKEAKKQFDIEFKKIEDSNLAKIKLIEQKQSNLLNTIDGLELRKAWSFGLIEEPNVVGLDETNFISKETEFKNGDSVETNNYEGYYYLSKPDKDGEWYEQIIGKTEKEVEDKINAKYDAELDALKEQKDNTTINNLVKQKENECKTGTPSDLTGFDLFD